MIFHGDGIEMLTSIEDGAVQLLWTDPPFGTNKRQRVASSGTYYEDVDVSGVVTLIECLGREAKRVLSSDGVLAVCLDYRAIHPACVALMRDLKPLGEVIWTFGLGRGSTNWWTNKHNTVALFSRYGVHPRFHYERVPTTVRKAPKAGYAYDKKVASVWDYTLSNTDPERVGYPNQKPEAIIEPFVLVHTDEDDLVVDPFGGSGSTAAVAKRLKRRYAIADINPVAITTMRKRLNTVD